MNLAVKSHHHGNRVLGYCIWRISRDARYVDPFKGCLKVDVVIYGAAQADNLDAAFDQVLDDTGVDVIIYKNADAGKAAGKINGLRGQFRVKIADIKAIVEVYRVE